ncbi:lasso peptide biosynthesis B2 protein [Nostoc sp. NIES-2111]
MGRRVVQLKILVKCVAALATVRTLMLFLRQNSIRRLMVRPGARGAAPEGLYRQVAWGMDLAAKVVPDATCLARAMAGQALLARSGYASDVCIGVEKADGKFAAHAWLTSGGAIVLGGTEAELSRYVRMTSFPAGPS